jgi:hypothetical protein
MVVVRNGVVVLAENMDLRSVYASGFEFLLDSIQIVKIGAYVVMPFHAVFPRDNELQIRIRLSSN